jgi:hypothetical protein
MKNTDKLYKNYRKVEAAHLKGKTDQQLDAIWEKVSDAYKFGNLSSAAESAIKKFLKEKGYIA